MKTLKALTTATIASAVLSVGAVSASAATSTGEIGFQTGGINFDMTNTAIDFSFDTHQIGFDAWSSPIQVLGADKDHFFTIEDARGSGTGWTLSVKEQAQFAYGTNVLTGAELYFNKIAHSTTNSDTTDLSLVSAPTLIDTNNTPIMKAAANHGMGVHTGTFTGAAGTNENSNATYDAVTLKIPTSTAVFAGNYTTTLEWTITEGP